MTEVHLSLALIAAFCCGENTVTFEGAGEGEQLLQSVLGAELFGGDDLPLVSGQRHRRRFVFFGLEYVTMKINIVGSAVDSACPGQQFAASYVIDDCVAIDAGSIGFQSSVATQRQIRDVFLSHGHMDHIASLPMFLDNVHQPGQKCVRVHGLPETLDSLRKDVFNDRIWPDLVRLCQEESPFMEFCPIHVGDTVAAGGLRVTAIVLDHVVPTIGFVASDSGGSVAFVSDTAPLESIWQTLNGIPDLKGLFLESAFPTRMGWLAAKAKHLTPTLFAEGCRKLRHRVPIVAVHIKPAYHDEILNEFASLEIPGLVIGSPDVCYEF